MSVTLAVARCAGFVAALLFSPGLADSPWATCCRPLRGLIVQRHWIAIDLTNRLCLGEIPTAIKDLPARAIEPHHVIPAVHDRQTVCRLTVALPELDRDRTIRLLFRCNAVHGICVEVVLLEVSGLVVNGDRPEG